MNARPVSSPKSPPRRTTSVPGDVLAFLLHRPAVPTLVSFDSPEEREAYSHRILQRIGVDVSSYSVLNLHQIGIDAPTRHVFEEALAWDGDSTCWPSHLATAERVDGRLEEIVVRPLGGCRLPFGRKAALTSRLRPLFKMKALRIQSVPHGSEPDNARYLLYQCSGGYPIGIFTLYVRSSIAAQGETGSCQVFLGVGFDFLGEHRLSRFLPLTWLWKSVHDRVTANVLNRFKQLCEWRFERTQAGL